MIEKGNPIASRACPKANVGHCVSCKPFCHITTGFSGAGAFSDGKLSLSEEVGGNLVDKQKIAAGQLSDITALANQYVAAVNS